MPRFYGNTARVSASTILIAASDSMNRAYADYVAGGANADIAIQSAVAALPAFVSETGLGGGEIQLQQGSYTMASGVTVNVSNHGPLIQGAGWGTRLTPPSGEFAFTLGSSGIFCYGTRFKHFTLEGASGKGFSMPNADSIVVEDVKARYIDVFAEILGEAGESNWVTFRDVTAWYIQTKGVDIDASICRFERVYLHTGINTVVLFRVRATSGSVVIEDCLFETGGTAESRADIGVQADAGNEGVRIYNTLFNSWFKTYAVLMGSSNGIIKGCHFHNNNVLSISVPLNVRNTVIENNYWTGSVAQCADVIGYGNRGIVFRNNDFSGATVGVIQEDKILALRAALGIDVSSADVCYPFCNDDGVNTRVWDISQEVRNLWVYGSPTWGTIAKTGWGTLACTSAGSHYGRWPASGYDKVLNVTGDKTMVWAGTLDFTPDGTSRNLLGLGNVNVYSGVHFGFLYDGPDDKLHFEVQDSALAFHYGVLRDGTEDPWASGIPVVLVGTINSSTGAMESWINGNKVDTDTTGALNSSVQALWLNCSGYQEGYQFGDATHSFAALFSRVLSNAEIEIISNRLLGLMGYAMTARGTGNLTAGLTNVDIAHGLASTPKHITITPTMDTGGKRWYVSTRSDTSFRFEIDSVHGFDISFDWEATTA